MRTRERKGAIVILVALLIVALLGFGAFAVDISQMQAYKSELRRSADAAVLAATLQLLHETDHVNARAQADLMLSDNPVFGGVASITSFEYGTYDDVARRFTMCAGCSAAANAIRLSVQGPERSFYLAQFIGGTDFSLSIQATAWLPVAATPCVAPWVVLETDWIASGVAAHSNSHLRGMATSTPGPGSKSFIPKWHDPDPVGNYTQTFGAINLPAYNDGIPPSPELLSYAQNIARLGGCYSLEAFDVVQAKLTGLDDETIDGVSGIGGVSSLCEQLTDVACYNRGGQIGVAVRLPIVIPATSPIGVQCAANPYFRLPAGFNELPSGGAICHEVVDVRTFVLVRSNRSTSVEKGLVLAVYAGNDTDGPVRGYAQRPILVQ